MTTLCIECHYAEFQFLFIIMLSVIVLSVVAPNMLSFVGTIKPKLLNQDIKVMKLFLTLML